MQAFEFVVWSRKHFLSSRETSETCSSEHPERSKRAQVHFSRGSCSRASSVCERSLRTKVKPVYVCRHDQFGDFSLTLFARIFGRACVFHRGHGGREFRMFKFQSCSGGQHWRWQVESAAAFSPRCLRIGGQANCWCWALLSRSGGARAECQG